MKIDFSIIKEITLTDGSIELYLKIEPAHQVFLGYILEGLDGFCYHTIARNIPGECLPELKRGNILKLTIVPDYYQEIVNLLNELRGNN